MVWINIVHLVMLLQVVLTAASHWTFKKDDFAGSVDCKEGGDEALKCTTSNPVNDSVNAGLFKNGALYEQELPEGLTSLKFTIVEGSAVDLGITDKSKFNKDARGLFYEGRGRLSDGQNAIIYTLTSKGASARRGIMVNEYGPELKTGDEVLLTCNITRDSIHLYFTVNGLPLGGAFDIPRSSLEDKIYPVVKVPVGADSTVKLEFVTDASPILVRAPQKRLEPLDGRYVYVSGSIQNPKDRGIVLKFTKPANLENTLYASIDVINTLSFSLKRVDDEGKRWVCSGGMTSLVGGPPEDMQLESQFSKFFWGKELTFHEESDEFLFAKNLEGGELKWKRLYLVPQVITFNPFEE